MAERGKSAARHWDVDVARGVAMAMVALYHLVFDLDNFGGYPVDSTGGFWAVFADASAFSFVFLAGLSLSISHARERESGRSPFGKYLRRGARIFADGMLITAVFLALDYGYVLFGILHLIGLSIVLAYPFLGLRYSNLIVGLAVIAAGLYVRGEGFVVGGATGVLLSPLGVLPESLPMPDYRPLLPWFGVVLLGLFFGNAFYLARKGSPAAPPPLAAPLAFIGRHTLFIYLVHQPVLIATLWALGIVRF
ncbi:heparan-alpha-glucosaminide N-acetyltransferase [Rubrobacter tropicus]|uniref:heparan-alpha-glucosaminide N-acetyltransferase n=1 Tax=Rubrobacter tropicus TaxID=2653851 RepID=UPI001A9CD682|nr:heparan-alpha-glucosaminide N-acetyltransferase [Rubrobacter tropicus]